MTFKKIVVSLSFAIISFQAFSQSGAVSVNETGALADPSSILDVSSQTKGVLISRVTSEEKYAIKNPAMGLMVYDTTIKCLCIFNGTSWEPICPDKNLDDGLLAHYKFDGNYGDSSGNNLHLTSHGGTVFTTDRQGKPNKAVLLDGINDYLDVNDLGILSVPTVSISLHFKTSALKIQELVTRMRYSDSHNFSWVTAISSSNSPGVGFTPNFTTINNTSGTLCEQAVVINQGDILLSQQQLQANQWYHLVCVFDRGIQKIYVNGILKAEIKRTFKTLPVCGSSQLVIGSWWNGDPTFFQGAIDEIRIYGRKLNEAEIAQLTITL